MPTFEELLEMIDAPDSRSPESALGKAAGNITEEEGYRLQYASKERIAERGDAIVGHQGSYTSRVMLQKSPDRKGPYFGTMLRSYLERDDEPLPLIAPSILECELGVLMKRDLPDPNPSPAQVIAAIEGYMPAIEIPRRVAGLNTSGRSLQHTLAIHNSGSSIYFGRVLTPTTIEIRLEGIVASIDGQVVGSACAAESMGDPINVIIAMATHLVKYGQYIKAGQILMTGTNIAQLPLTPANTNLRVEYTRLGSINLQIADGTKS